MAGPKTLVAGTLLSVFSAIAPTGCAGRSGRAVPVPSAMSARSASAPAPAVLPPPRAARATVAYVIDGDTIVVTTRAVSLTSPTSSILSTSSASGARASGRPRGHPAERPAGPPSARARRVRVRLLGLDAPEDTRRRGCFGAQATAALRRLLPEGAAILVAVDQRRADPYGRALGYVWRADGTFVNQALVRRGYATTLFLPPAGPYRAELAAAEALARTARAGLWRACRRPS